MKHEKFIGKGEKRWIGLVRKGKRKAAKACGFSFYLVDFVDTLKTPVTSITPFGSPVSRGTETPRGNVGLKLISRFAGIDSVDTLKTPVNF